mmetsp:Transcript_66874/g.131624  ORF Transcript_66874/g.131624 Transcript_66874/m.131624 type:complete len:219 (+) Transcript_66874:235-891(+)
MQGKPREPVGVFPSLECMAVQFVVRVEGSGQLLLEEFFLCRIQLRMVEGQGPDGRQRFHTSVHQLFQTTDAQDSLALRHDPARIVVVACVLLGAGSGLGKRQAALEHPNLCLERLAFVGKGDVHLLDFLLQFLDMELVLPLLLLVCPLPLLHFQQGAADLLLQKSQLSAHLLKVVRQSPPLLQQCIAFFFEGFGFLRHFIQRRIRLVQFTLAILERVF